MSSFWTGDVGRHRNTLLELRTVPQRFFASNSLDSALHLAFVKCGSCYDAVVFPPFDSNMYKAYWIDAARPSMAGSRLVPLSGIALTSPHSLNKAQLHSQLASSVLTSLKNVIGRVGTLFSMPISIRKPSRLG